MKRSIKFTSEHEDIDGLKICLAIDLLNKLAQEFGSNATIDFRGKYEYDTTFIVSNYREETDEEYKERLLQDATRTQRELQQKRVQFEKLKLELGEI